jgi:hypothetical protein
MTIYPATGYDTFISVADADTLAATYLNADQWSALTSDEKERYLYTAFRYIVAEITPPEQPNDDTPCLPKAQVEIVMNDLRFGISTQANAKETKVEQVGSLKVEYFEDKEGPQVIPSMALQCLRKFGEFGDFTIGTLPKKR